jgi:hypothetical protein
MKKKPKPKPNPKPKRARGRPEKYTVAQMVAAIQQNKGFLYLAAKSLGCHHSTLLDYRTRYPEVAAAFKVQRGEMIDTGELALYNAVLKGEAWAVCFLLKTQAKDRGYVERQEHTGKGGGPIDVNLPDAERVARIVALLAAARTRRAAAPPETPAVLDAAARAAKPGI